MFEYILLLIGFAVLVKGADVLIDGASALAKRLGVSDLMIGLSVVAFGTSLPELLVNIFAAIQNNSAISLGNVIGSNIFNILAILGLLAFISRLKVHYSTTWKEIPFALLATILLFAFVNDVYFDKSSVNALGRSDGLAFLAFFVIFVYYLYEVAKGERNGNAVYEYGQRAYSLKKIVLFLVIGIFGLFIGGRLVVDNAITIATNIGISEFFISATIIAIATALPELITSIIAAMKKNVDMAVGNIVGSNIFNIFLVLGITAIINPVSFDDSLNIDMLFLILATAILFVFIFTFKPYRIDKPEGIMFLLLYLAYLIFLIYRG